MKAARFYGTSARHDPAPMVLEEVPTPVPGAGEVLVKVAACGVCRTDLDYLKGEAPPLMAPPLILGHEPSGTICEIGPGVSGFQVGQRVLVTAPIPCRTCAICRRGDENQCANMTILGASRDGAFAEYLVAPSSGVFSVPDGLPLEDSCIITDAIATSYHALYRRAKLLPGETIAIFGASGGLGLVCVQFAVASGATVIAVGRKKWKLEKAREMGAAEIIGTEEVEKVDSFIRRLTGGGGDIALDATAVPAMIETAFRSTRAGGRLVVLSMGYQKFQLALNHLTWLERTVMGSKNYLPADMPKIIGLVNKGIIDLKKVISHRFRLEEVNDAYQMLDRGEMLRGIVIP